MKKYKHIMVASIVGLVLLGGCGRLAKEDEVGSDSAAAPVITETQKESQNETFSVKDEEVIRFDKTPQGGKEITAELMTDAKTQDNKGYCYSYSKEGFDIKLEYNNAETGCITINGNKIALDYTKEVHEDNPQVVVRDVNGDGKVDILIKWEGWREYDAITMLSKGDTYVEAQLDAELPDISTVLQDNYKMKVICKECDVDEVYEMPVPYKLLLDSKKVYEDGKLINSQYVMDKSSVEIEYGFYDVAGETVVAVKQHLMELPYSTGVAVVSYYRCVDNRWYVTDVKVVNETYSAF